MKTNFKSQSARWGMARGSFDMGYEISTRAASVHEIVLRASEDKIQEALVELGWTPPQQDKCPHCNTELVLQPRIRNSVHINQVTERFITECCGQTVSVIPVRKHRVSVG